MFWHERQEISNYISIKVVFFQAFASVFCPCIQGMVYLQSCVMFITFRYCVSQNIDQTRESNTVNTVQMLKYLQNGALITET